jgi:hypothetical protein
MAHIVIIPTGNGGQSGNDIQIIGMAYLSDGNSVSWSAMIPMNGTALTINQIIRDAALQEVTNAQYEVGPNDKKTILGAAVGV